MWFDSQFIIPLDLKDKKKNRALLNKYKDNQIFQIVFNRMLHDALDRYEIKGITPTMNHRVILESLVWHGCVAIFEKGGNFLSLPVAPAGELTLYGDYASGYVYSKNGLLNEEIGLYVHGSDEDSFLKKLTTGISTGKGNGVLIRENATMFPFLQTVIYYAQCVADSYRTLDITKKHLKQPYIITAEESVVPTVEKFLQQVDNNYSEVISSGVFDVNKIKVLPLNISGENVTSITQLIEWYESKFRELCGINCNAQMDKKGENLISTEINVNNEYIGMGIDESIQYIQEGLDDANKLFGLNLKVVKKHGKEQNTGADTGRGDSGLSGTDPGDTTGSNN